MRFPWQREKRELQFGNADTAAVAQAAVGDRALPTGATGAMQTAAGWWARGFASASVSPSDSPLARALAPTMRFDIGRSLCYRGEGQYPHGRR